MKKMKCISMTWVVFLCITIGNVQGALVTDKVRGTVAEFLDRTISDEGVPISDPRVVIGGTIDLFEITYDTDFLVPNGGGGVFSPDLDFFGGGFTPETDWAKWSTEIVSLLNGDSEMPQYGGRPFRPFDEYHEPGVYFLDGSPYAYQYIGNDIEMTIFTSFAPGSAITMHDLFGNKSTIKFSDFDITTSPVPIPSTFGLLGLGLFIVAGARRRKH